MYNLLIDNVLELICSRNLFSQSMLRVLCRETLFVAFRFLLTEQHCFGSSVSFSSFVG